MKRFLPFMSGVYTTAPGLIPLSKAGEEIFDVDEEYSRYIDNKNRCREEDLSKYHCVHEFRETTQEAVNTYLKYQIALHNPSLLKIDYKKYISAFDALCSNLQEDVAVVQLDGNNDWLAAIHLCSPNHWDPRTKIGRPFNEIHVPVPGIERTVKNYQVMLKMIVDKDPFTRFAWGIATDAQLNHHPEVPPGYEPEVWRGRRVADENSEFFVRVERQNLVGLKEVNAFIFTIRTYFYKVAELDSEEKKALAKAVSSMTSASLEYKGMTLLKDALMKILLKKTAEQ